MLTISSPGRWTFSLVGEVDGTNFWYRPRNDFLFELEGCPFITITKDSDREEKNDRDRMLLETGLLVRVVNSLESKNERPSSFVAVAIYIRVDLYVQRYLVYQPDRSSQEVWTTNILQKSRTIAAHLYFYFFHRSAMLRTISISRLPLTHSSSFLSSTT